MPKRYQVRLSEEQREELRRRTRGPKLKPRTRDRLEMVRLSDAGFSIPRIAGLLGISEQQVRVWIKAYLRGGFDALPDALHPGRISSITPEIVAALRAEIERGEQTWTAKQLAAWVTEWFGVTVTPEHLGTRLKKAGIVWKRTSRSLTHKQDPTVVEAKKAELAVLEKKGK